MLATRVGYAGGRMPSPSYHHLGGHREAVEVTFDANRISYRQLLEVFWRGQPVDLPPGPDRRVDLGLLTRGEYQRISAEWSKERWRRALGERLYVDVLPEADFWPAERLHQKFHLQRAHSDLVHELALGYADVDAFLASTAAARLNAWVTGFAGEEALAEAARELRRGVDELRLRLTEPRSPELRAGASKPPPTTVQEPRRDGSTSAIFSASRGRIPPRCWNPTVPRPGR